MTETLYPTLVASPQTSFGELSEHLRKLGWKPESTSAQPIVPGEPELAVFVHAEDDTAIHYTFNPVVRLRVLQFRGSNAKAQHLQASRRIPVLGIDELRALLNSAEVKELLLGLFAAGELVEIGVIEQVARLCLHPEAKVARAAAQVRDSLLTGAVGRVASQLAEEQARHPERSAWFANLPQPELRKQVLRWLIRDSQASNENIDRVLHSALMDYDPEVRVTAILAAAKLKATNLIRAVRDTNVPTSTSLGADPRDRLFYERLRQTAVRYLAGSAGPATGDWHEGDKLESRRLQFQKAVSGELEVHDDPTLLLHSLTTPVELGTKPAELPAGVEEREGGYFLRRSGLALRWIAPIAHWLGEDSARAPLPNPIRQVTPKSGFFIAELPVSSELALWTSEPKAARRAAKTTASREPFLCGYQEALHLCEVLCQLEGVQLQLPTADQWEMAARGPDGRRYPWGNSLRKDGLLQPSPWLVRNMVGFATEWTNDRDAQGAHVLCGGSKALACAGREAASADDRNVQCAVRPVMNWTMQGSKP